MRTLERGRRHESLDKNISRIAFAYGFTNTPVAIPKKALTATDADAKTNAALSLIKNTPNVSGIRQVWGATRTGRGTTIAFAVISSRHAIGNALVVKTALSIAELSGLSDCTVLVSSIGDVESRKRFTRELTNFFKKHHDTVPEDVKALAVHDPDAAYRKLLSRKDPLLEKVPRTIDYLSENSRKTMMDTLAFFESVGIAYTLEPRLESHPGVQSELLFEIEATAKDGTRVRAATGGRYDEFLRKEKNNASEAATALSIYIPESTDLDGAEATPACFVVHVGDAAKLKAFILLESLWKARVAVTQGLMAENFRDQIEKGKQSGARYLAIIGQREALDKTIIVRNTVTQMQVTLPQEKLEAYVQRVHR